MCRFYSQNIALQLLKILFFLENMQCNVIGLNCRFLAHDLLNKLGLSMENSHNREESCHNVKIVPEIIRYGSTLTGPTALVREGPPTDLMYATKASENWN